MKVPAHANDRWHSPRSPTFHAGISRREPSSAARCFAIDRQQSVGKRAILGVVRFQQRQLDRFAKQVSPAFLRMREVGVHGRIVADHRCRRVENLIQCGGVLVHSEELYGIDSIHNRTISRSAGFTVWTATAMDDAGVDCSHVIGV